MEAAERKYGYDDYEDIVDRLLTCVVMSDCEQCEYKKDGCSYDFLCMEAAKALTGFIRPESSGWYDLEEIHKNCTVEVWKSSLTGEVSIGWYAEGDAV